MTTLVDRHEGRLGTTPNNRNRVRCIGDAVTMRTGGAIALATAERTERTTPSPIGGAACICTIAGATSTASSTSTNSTGDWAATVEQTNNIKQTNDIENDKLFIRAAP